MIKLGLNVQNQNYSPHGVMKFAKAQPCFCGHCNNSIGLDVYFEVYHNVVVEQVGRKSEKPYVDYYVGQCPICGKPVILDATTSSVLPPVKSFDKVKELPEDIEKLYNEMRDAYSVQAYTCCVITGRTLLANIAVEQGAQDNKGFVYYVDYLVDNFLPKSSGKQWVDKVRLLGNDSAHHMVIANKDMATTSMKFLEAILKNVYEFPNSI